jgi:CRP/FNR family transcriptional regulator, cyclic AMP receptor protein
MQDRLSGIELFAGLSPQERERVARWVDELQIQAGRHVVDEGRFAYEFFVIEEGEADVVQDGRRIAGMGPGDFFGEIALLDAERRSASVVATTPMRLLVMFRREFRRMVEEMPQIGERIRAAMAERLGRSADEAAPGT